VGFLQLFDFGCECSHVFFTQIFVDLGSFHLILSGLSADHAANKGGTKRQFGSSQAERFTS
jgi:hypothetical protein